MIPLRCVLIAVALSGLLGCAHTKPAKPQADAELSTINLLDLNGNPFDLWQHRQGHITVVLFTRTDCPISNRSAPEIRSLHETFHPRGVDFYLIYVDPREAPETIRRHLQEYAYPCPGLRDPQHTLVAYCHATATPEAVVFDRDRAINYQGRISDQYVDLGTAKAGPARHDLADAIESTVTGRPVATPRAKAIGCSIADLKE